MKEIYNNNYQLKLRFFKKIINWYEKEKCLNLLEEEFLLFSKDLNISMKDIEKSVEDKIIKRGGYNLNLLLKDLIIHNSEKKLIERFLLASNNIFQGQVILNGEVYYKFLYEKAVRDKSVIENDPCISTREPLDNSTFYNLLEIKLIEESKEVLRAKSEEELLEEMGDVLLILQELKKRKELKAKVN